MVCVAKCEQRKRRVVLPGWRQSGAGHQYSVEGPAAGVPQACRPPPCRRGRATVPLLYATFNQCALGSTALTFWEVPSTPEMKSKLPHHWRLEFGLCTGYQAHCTLAYKQDLTCHYY